jgi:hypothetical protein
VTEGNADETEIADTSDNLDRHVTPRETFKQNSAAALTEYGQLAA